MDDEILFKKEGLLGFLTLNRPDTRNPLGHTGDGERFKSIVSEANADKNLRCIIMTGNGKAFSAGGDLKSMKEKTGHFGGSPLQLRDHYRESIHGIIKSLWNIEVPLVGAINGPAIGLGNDVASLCDIRIASKNAKFAASFLKMGLIPGDGGAWILPRHVGLSRAAQLFFTGEVIDADTALEWGLISEVVSEDQLMARAHQIADKISQQPPQALRMTKKMMRDALTTTFDNTMEISAALQVTLQNTDDHMEAVNAFFEKRKPVFKGS